MRLNTFLAGLLATSAASCGGQGTSKGGSQSPATSDDGAATDDGSSSDDGAPSTGQNATAKKDGGAAVNRPGKDGGAPTKDGAAPTSTGGNPVTTRNDAGPASPAGTDDPETSKPDAGTPPASSDDKPQLAVSADFLNQTLTVFNVDKMVEGASRKDVLVGKVDLSKYSPGPVALNVTPDGKTALVSISPSFLDAFVTIPPGDGILLFVDLTTLTVVGELNTGVKPMGIIITQDGKHAFVGQLSDTYISYVDIEKRTFEKLQTGAQWNEELAMDDTGTVGIVSYGTGGDAKTFSIANPKMMGQTTGLSGDAGGTAFFPGTKIAYLVQAPTDLTFNVGGHNVVDVTNPTMPVVSDNIRIQAPKMYPCTAVKSRKTVVYPSFENNMAYLTEMKLEGTVAKEAQKLPIGPAGNLPYGVSSTPDNRVLIAVPGDHYIGVVDLETKKAFQVPWEQTKSGPNDIKMIPKN